MKTYDCFTNTYIFKEKKIKYYIATSFPLSFSLSQMIDVITLSF